MNARRLGDRPGEREVREVDDDDMDDRGERDGRRKKKKLAGGRRGKGHTYIVGWCGGWGIVLAVPAAQQGSLSERNQGDHRRPCIYLHALSLALSPFV